jgi:hypothetical protein
VNLGLAQEVLPGRHLVVATIGDGLDDGLFSTAIQPDVVSQVRCTQLLVTLAVRTVAGCADGGEGFLAAGARSASCFLPDSDIT